MAEKVEKSVESRSEIYQGNVPEGGREQSLEATR